jgi:hypothetical protein
VHQCPHVNIKIGKITFSALFDSGAQVSIISEDVYEQLIINNGAYPTVPVSSTVLVSAFNSKFKRIKKQTLIGFVIGEKDKYENVFLVAPRLITPVILGSDFLYEHGAVMDFVTESIRTEKDGETKCYKFQEDDAGRFKRERDTNLALYNDSEEAHFNHIQLQETGEILGLGFNASTAANRDVHNSHKETINAGKVRDKETPMMNDVL